MANPDTTPFEMAPVRFWDRVVDDTGEQQAVAPWLLNLAEQWELHTTDERLPLEQTRLLRALVAHTNGQPIDDLPFERYVIWMLDQAEADTADKALQVLGRFCELFLELLSDWKAMNDAEA